MKLKLLVSAACVLCAHPAFAQDAADGATDEPENNAIVVVGTKLSRLKAIEEKRDESRIIDALGIDELGQLPDKNVGESLNRLPGVTMLVEKGEGRFVQIRGINPGLNNVTINGVSLDSPESAGRSAPLDVISGSVLGGVQVIKTPTPDMDAQGIGGTVNVDTAMPFDRRDMFYGYVTGRYGYEEIRPKKAESFGGHDPYAIDALVSGKLAGDTLGWLLGASWSDREYVAQGRYQDIWGGSVRPINVKNNYYIIGRERLNLNGALEWRPDDDTQLFVRGFYADWNEFQHRNRFEENLDAGVVVLGERNGISGPNAEVHISHTRVITSPTIIRELRRRNAIEPIIGHIKVDGLLERNHLKGAAGDVINAILAAAGHNMRLLIAWFPMNHAISAKGIPKITLLLK